MFALYVLCTGNVCRSPMAEHFFRRALTARGLVDDEDFVVYGGGTGVHGDGKATISNGSWRELKLRGIDATGHVARGLTAELLEAADLVVTMEANHVREAVLIDPDVRDRCYTLKEISGLLDALARDGVAMPLGADRLGLLVSVRGRLPVGNDDLDVVDPIGGSPKLYARVALEIEEHVEHVVTRIWGPGSYSGDAETPPSRGRKRGDGSSLSPEGDRPTRHPFRRLRLGG